jgi:hypothetical protein
MAEPSRRFPPPWRVDTIPGGYVVRDASGQALAFSYSRSSEAEARRANVLTADETLRIAVPSTSRSSSLATAQPAAHTAIASTNLPDSVSAAA